MIAMALSCNPKVLIADEPTTALDVTIQAQILELMQELQSMLGTAIIMITHDLGVIAETAQRVAVMYAGRKVEEADVLALFDNPLHPYTRGLMKAIPGMDIDLTRRFRRDRGSTRSKAWCRPSANCRLAVPLRRVATWPRTCVAAKDPPLEKKAPNHWTACWHAGAADDRSCSSPPA